MTLLVDELNGGGSEEKPHTIGTKAVRRFEAVSELCNVAVVDASESSADVCVEPVGLSCSE